MRDDLSRRFIFFCEPVKLQILLIVSFVCVKKTLSQRSSYYMHGIQVPINLISLPWPYIDEILRHLTLHHASNVDDITKRYFTHGLVAIFHGNEAAFH